MGTWPAVCTVVTGCEHGHDQFRARRLLRLRITMKRRVTEGSHATVEGGWSLWDEVVRLHRARQRRSAPSRTAILTGSSAGEKSIADWLPVLSAPDRSWLALDDVVVLGETGSDEPLSRPRLRRERRFKSGVVGVLGALVDRLVESPDSQIIVIDRATACPESLPAIAIQRALIATEADPRAVVLIGDDSDAASTAFIAPTGLGVVRPAVVLRAPSDPASAQRLVGRGALRDSGIVVARGQALFEVFMRHHPLLVRMFTYAAELPPEKRDPYLEASCDDLPQAPWSLDMIAGHPTLQVVEAGPGLERRHSRTISACPPEEASDDVAQEH